MVVAEGDANVNERDDELVERFEDDLASALERVTAYARELEGENGHGEKKDPCALDLVALTEKLAVEVAGDVLDGDDETKAMKVSGAGVVVGQKRNVDEVAEAETKKRHDGGAKP